MKGNKFFYIGFTALSAVFFVTSAIMGHWLNLSKEAVFTAASPDEICIVIDAGHGGEDGGCVSDDGVLEKELNLEVADKVAELLNLMGYNTLMTRSSDEMLYDMYGDDYSGKKKTFDLKNRLRFTRENEADALVSIHMNKFPKPQYKGLQVYYSKNHTDSITIAEKIQQYTAIFFQKDNKREIKKADKNIYILDRAEMPAVLVECGFLSNAEETRLLCEENYRKELGFVIASAVAAYFES